MLTRRSPVAARAVAAALMTAGVVAGTPARAADAALIAAARQEGSVTWYTTQTINQLVRPLAEAFENAYGIKLNYIRANSTEVAMRVQNEASAGQAGRRSIPIAGCQNEKPENDKDNRGHFVDQQGL